MADDLEQWEKDHIRDSIMRNGRSDEDLYEAVAEIAETRVKAEVERLRTVVAAETTSLVDELGKHVKAVLPALRVVRDGGTWVGANFESSMDTLIEIYEPTEPYVAPTVTASPRGHSGPRPTMTFVCEKCGYTTMKESSLDTHIRVVHPSRSARVARALGFKP